MALIICPECGAKVSDKAEQCPKCAYPIKQQKSKHTKTEIVVKSKEGCFLQTLNAGCLIIAIIIALIIGFVILALIFAG